MLKMLKKLFQVYEVLASSSIGDLQVAERPGSRQAEMEISPDIAAEVSEVITHSTVQELKPGEVPGSREAKYTLPSDVAMQVSEVTTQGKLHLLIKLENTFIVKIQNICSIS